MSQPRFLARPSVIAVLTGALVLVVCSLIRVAAKPIVESVPVLPVIATLAVFLVPSVITGLVAPRSCFWNGAILGGAAAIFVAMESNRFQLPNWSSILIYEAIGIFACLSVPLCILGAFGGSLVRLRSPRL